MEYNKAIETMRAGDEIEGYYLLQRASIKTSTSGRPYLNASIADAGGSMEAKAWDYAGPLSTVDEGKVIKVRGKVSEYRGALQFVFDRVRLAEPQDPVDYSTLVAVAPICVEDSYAQILRLVDSMEDTDYQAVCRLMLERHGQEFKTIPAGKSMHHSFLNGLLMHTINMLTTADFLSRLYADTVNRDLLLAGTLLHDFAKSREFTLSPLGLVAEYSVPGQLLGHLVMGAQEIAAVAAELCIPEEKSLLLQHMILSHHGDPEFGAAVRPMCAESELLSLIDLMDSRMEIYREAMESTPVGAFSQRLYALDKKIYHHPFSPLAEAERL